MPLECQTAASSIISSILPHCRKFLYDLCGIKWAYWYLNRLEFSKHEIIWNQIQARNSHAAHTVACQGLSTNARVTKRLLKSSLFLFAAEKRPLRKGLMACTTNLRATGHYALPAQGASKDLGVWLKIRTPAPDKLNILSQHAAACGTVSDRVVAECRLSSIWATDSSSASSCVGDETKAAWLAGGRQRVHPWRPSFNPLNARRNNRNHCIFEPHGPAQLAQTICCEWLMIFHDIPMAYWSALSVYDCLFPPRVCTNTIAAVKPSWTLPCSSANSDLRVWCLNLCLKKCGGALEVFVMVLAWKALATPCSFKSESSWVWQTHLCKCNEMRSYEIQIDATATSIWTHEKSKEFWTQKQARLAGMAVQPSINYPLDPRKKAALGGCCRRKGPVQPTAVPQAVPMTLHWCLRPILFSTSQHQFV